jgi:hypothetical protein
VAACSDLSIAPLEPRHISDRPDPRFGLLQTELGVSSVLILEAAGFARVVHALA